MNAPAQVRPAPDRAPAPPGRRLRRLACRVREGRHRFGPPWGERQKAWLHAHRTILLTLGIPLVLVIVATAWNLQGWPGRVDEDEGTYVAEAWAMIYEHHLAPYTYWYDHPPLGWAQLAAYIWLTDGFARYSSSVEVGREFMLLVTVASSVLTYVLCPSAWRSARRRPGSRWRCSGSRRWPSTTTAWSRSTTSGRSGCSPPWSPPPRGGGTWPPRSGPGFLGGGRAQQGDHRDPAAGGVLADLAAGAVAHAQVAPGDLHGHGRAVHRLLPAVRRAAGRAVPRRGHVSLLWAVWWQLLGRTGSGFLLASGTAANGLLTLWLGTDRWLLLSGLALAPPAFFVRRLRPLAFGLLLQAVMALTGGYLPYFYVTAMLPFAALVIGGVVDTLMEPGQPRTCSSGVAASW